MKKYYIFAVPHKKEGYCIDARNPYNWEEVGAIMFEGEPSEAEVMEARRVNGIPESAYCVACKLLEA
nr:MAG TPA: hypothetical protein [Caudoviricetes sp.]